MTERLSDELADLLKEHENQLLGLSARLGFIMNVHAELTRVTRGKPFTIWNLPVYQCVLGERDMVIVDAASWAKAFYSRGCLLGKLQAGGLKPLAAGWQYGADDDEYWRGHNAAWRAETFASLFPAATGKTPRADDVRALVARLSAELEPLVTDRSEHRAHKFEKGGKGTVAMLAPGAVAPHIVTCRDVLAGIRCLSSNSSFHAHGLPPEANPDDKQAQDVVDLILCGTIGWIVDGEPSKGHAPGDVRWWQRRPAYYARLHAEHDARGGGEDDTFNGRKAP